MKIQCLKIKLKFWLNRFQVVQMWSGLFQQNKSKMLTSVTKFQFKHFLQTIQSNSLTSPFWFHFSKKNSYWTTWKVVCSIFDPFLKSPRNEKMSLRKREKNGVQPNENINDVEEKNRQPKGNSLLFLLQ
jgi:hypothetical protein